MSLALSRRRMRLTFGELLPGVGVAHFVRPNARWLAGDPQKNAHNAMPTRKLRQEAHQDSRHRMFQKYDRPP